MGEYNESTGKLYTTDEAKQWAKDQDDYIEAIKNYYTSFHIYIMFRSNEN